MSADGISKDQVPPGSSGSPQSQDLHQHQPSVLAPPVSAPGGVRKRKRRFLFRLACMATLAFSSDFLSGVLGSAASAAKDSSQMVAAMAKVPESARIIPSDALSQRAALPRRRYAVVRRRRKDLLEATSMAELNRDSSLPTSYQEMTDENNGVTSLPSAERQRRRSIVSKDAPIKTKESLATSTLDSILSKDKNSQQQKMMAASRASNSFVSDAVKRVGPAVVRIDSERLGMLAGLDQLGGDLDRGQGSGFIISENGEILTNCHVVEGADKVTVTLTDGRKYLATVKGYDEMVDLAVIKIDVGSDKALPVAPLADSEAISMGDWVIALGNPIGLDNTVTLGIISNVKRSSHELGMGIMRSSFIQTDAAINPGNSGGPLVNEFGEVVGINTAIFANAEGIGFAIPINKAKEIMGDLSQGKSIQHPYIGVMMVTITPEFAQQYNADPNTGTPIPEVHGVMVVHVLPDGPAGKCGLRKGDILMEVNGQRVRATEDGQRYVDESRVGDALKMTVLRGGKQMDVFVQTEDYAALIRAEKEKQKEMESALGNLLPKLFQLPDSSEESGSFPPAPRRPPPRGHRRFAP
eukprot:CAMPEP_0117750194 /NCGR_PEP_ID=MMETSP0947-20121206/10207_1 /TAXON_ID=44440 /ORGANISM="Chattonella subsalsa, Strain CCMP2191" /LENGTH=580 /DNA_ID=CAMNT_0005568283 /DNA_START=274 /DNA_END=2016 /DNA_ORIENTATION=+